MTVLLGVFGASGFAREVMPLVSISLKTGMRAVFVDQQAGPSISGYEVMDEEGFYSWKGHRRFIVAIGESDKRRQIFDQAQQHGAEPFETRSPSATILNAVDIGPGAILCGNTIVTSNVQIGRGFHLNIYSYVAHDCVIGDFVTFAPRVSCNGNVRIEDGAYIGTGAVLRQGKLGDPLVIGAGAVVGMGAVVTKSVPPGVTVVGNPARQIKPTQVL